jgi:arginine decarboxylase
MYHIDRWGAGYYDINTAGRVVAKPLPGDGTAVELSAVIAAAQKRDLDGPLLIRFQDILRHRVKSLCTAFDEAIDRNGYEGRYRGVFPIKVNELREVVEEVVEAGADHEFGLEVGSKAELFAALALQDFQNALLICNGYKDADFIRTALTGTRLGKQVILVIEKLDELDQILRVAKSEGVQPQLGIRLRLLSRSTGKWADSGGEDAKFGLNTAQLMAAIGAPAGGGLGGIFAPTAFPYRVAGTGYSHCA